MNLGGFVRFAYPVQNRPPIAYLLLSSTEVVPLNLIKTKLLGEDPSSTSFYLNRQRIHVSTIVCSQRQPEECHGLGQGKEVMPPEQTSTATSNQYFFPRDPSKARTHKLSPFQAYVPSSQTLKPDRSIPSENPGTTRHGAHIQDMAYCYCYCYCYVGDIRMAAGYALRYVAVCWLAPRLSPCCIFPFHDDRSSHLAGPLFHLRHVGTLSLLSLSISSLLWQARRSCTHQRRWLPLHNMCTSRPSSFAVGERRGCTAPRRACRRDG